ncbi:MAG: hypothetical protein ABIF92_02465 [archaeon]
MDQPTYSTQTDFANNVLRLVNQSTKFIEGMKQIKPMQSGTTGHMENVKKQICSADVSNVSNIGIDLDSLDSELQKLLNKFFMVQSSYNKDAKLTNFLGDFAKNPQDAYTKLVSYSDGCIQQIDAVITAYSRVEKGITKADLWIKHMLSNYSPEGVSEKARSARAIVNELSKVVAKVREACHNSKLELLSVRNLSVKYAKPRAQ